MRIAVLMTDAFATYGGVQLVNRSIVRVLSRNPKLQAEFFSLGDHTPDKGITGEHPFHCFKGSRLRFTIAVNWALLTGDFDLLFVTHRNLFPLALPWRATGKPYVLFAHGFEIWTRQSPLYREILHGASLVLTNSKFTRDRICAANGVPILRTQVTGLCVDGLCGNDSFGTVSQREEGNSHFLLLTVGRMARGEQYKGQDTVIRALPEILRSFPQTRYVLVGGGNDQPRLKELSHELGVAANVDFLGQVSEDVREQLYRRSTIFVMPSRGEGFGLVYLEAMQHGLPCIAGNCDAGPEVVRNGVNGFTVDPTNPAEVSRAVLQLLLDRDLRSRMGQAGVQILRSEYSYEAFSERLLSALEKAASRNANR